MWNDVKDATNYILSKHGYRHYVEQVGKDKKDIVKNVFNNNLPSAMKEAIFDERYSNLRCNFFNDTDTINNNDIVLAEKIDDCLMTIMIGFEKLDKNGYIGE